MIENGLFWVSGDDTRILGVMRLVERSARFSFSPMIRGWTEFDLDAYMVDRNLRGRRIAYKNLLVL